MWPTHSSQYLLSPSLSHNHSIYWCCPLIVVSTYVTVQCLSICLSVPSIESSSDTQLVCHSLGSGGRYQSIAVGAMYQLVTDVCRCQHHVESQGMIHASDLAPWQYKCFYCIVLYEAQHRLVATVSTHYNHWPLPTTTTENKRPVCTRMHNRTTWQTFSTLSLSVLASIRLQGL